MTLSLEKILSFLVALSLLLNGLLYQYIQRVETKADTTASLNVEFQVFKSETKGLFERNKDRIDGLGGSVEKFLDQARDSRLFEPKRAH